MAIVVNYAHPLGETAKRQIGEVIGSFEEVLIPCQIDMSEPIVPQLESLLAQWPYGAHYVVPPGLSFAAAYLVGRQGYAISDAMRPVLPSIIVLRREGTPPEFVLAEIIRT